MKRKAKRREDAITETYLDCAGYMNALTYHFVRRFGGEYDDCRSIANIAFMYAYAHHEPSKGTFMDYVKWCVICDLKSDLRRRLSKRKYGTTSALVEEPHVFNLTDFLDELSADARSIVNLVIESPPVLQRQPFNSARKTLYDYLKETLKWKNERIIDAFRLIQNTLRNR